MTDVLPRTELSSNWKQLQKTLNAGLPKRAQDVAAKDSELKSKKRRKTDDRSPTKTFSAKKSPSNETPTKIRDSQRHLASLSEAQSSKGAEPSESPNRENQLGQYLAIDCEMVGVTSRDVSALARVSIVNFHGHPVYDKYVRPSQPVTNWRTPVSGIRPKDMINALPLHEVQEEVRELFRDRIVVGHSLKHDLSLIGYIPFDRRRDTAQYEGYRKLVGGATPGLKLLTSQILGIDIQGGEHNSVEDARAAMLLYRHAKKGMDEQFGGATLRRKRIVFEEKKEDEKEPKDPDAERRAAKRNKRLKKKRH
jgi:RNA exonuclease 4